VVEVEADRGSGASSPWFGLGPLALLRFGCILATLEN
jgi:hypothetical protein